MTNYQVTARKWRPQDFSQVVGQEHVTTALTNAINSGKVPHAYLFSGPRGVGKTSTARILSKLLNCIHSPNICGECAACKEITLGQSLDVREIDGASNRGIEQIREIRDNAIYTPLSLKYKIFIIDEVHMLTKEASNALLKILEEPPSHVIFMLATTESNKVLPTIRSRCQHYLLKRISLEILMERLAFILDNEGYTYEREALEEIANAGDGSMRDAQTILDQVILYSQGNLTLTATREVLGVPDTIYFEKIVQALITQDIVTILEQANVYLMEVGDGMSFAENFTKFLRKALLVKKLPPNHALLDLSQEKYDILVGVLGDLEESQVLTLLNLSLDLCDTLKKETSERFWIESTLFKMFDYKNRISLSELRQEIFKVIGRGGGAQRPTAPAQQTTHTQQQSTPSNPAPTGSFSAQLDASRNANTQTKAPTGSFSAQLDASRNISEREQSPPIEPKFKSMFPEKTATPKEPKIESMFPEELITPREPEIKNITPKEVPIVNNIEIPVGVEQTIQQTTPSPVEVPIEKRVENISTENLSAESPSIETPSEQKTPSSGGNMEDTIKNLFEIP